MPEIIQSRRSFVRGLGSLFVAAPAIVRASSLMQVKAVKWGDFSQAMTATISVSSDGTISWVEIISAGSGYTSTPLYSPVPSVWLPENA